MYYRSASLMISAAGSGFGKSVVTMGLLDAMKKRGIRLQAFKCGPDYIDPGFHRRVLGIACRNLDTYLMGEEEVLEEVTGAGQSLFFAVCEGAMGLYDGLGGGIEHSAYSIASLCRMPVLVVLDSSRDETCAHQLKRLLERDEEGLIRAVLVNRCSDTEYRTVIREINEVLSGNSDAPEASGRLMICGHLPRMPEAELSSRHLGLVQAREVENLAGKVHKIAAALEEDGVVDRVLTLAGALPGTQDIRADHKASGNGCLAADMRRCTIAVARDEAFSFVYQRSLENLARAGAGLSFFSLLHDDTLPEGTDGLYLPGGYPELYAPLLEKNALMRRSVYRAVKGSMPTVAECGGFMYLGQEIYGEDGRAYKMAGVLPGCAMKQDGLVRFGYLELTQEHGSSLLFDEGETVRAHEFHYWDSDCCGEDLLAVKRSRGSVWRCAYTAENLYAAFPHLYLNKDMAKRFVDAAARSRTGLHGSLPELRSRTGLHGSLPESHS